MKLRSRILSIIACIAAVLAIPHGHAASAPSGHSQQASSATLPNLHINALTQDSLGYIWVGTANGLCRDKGNGYDVFSSDKSNPATIPSNNVIALLYRNGTLWVATARGVVSKAAESNSFVRYSVDTDDSHAEGFYSGFIVYRGKLYTYGYNGLYEIDPVNHKLLPKVEIDRHNIGAAAIDSNGRLWLAAGGELLCFDGMFQVKKRVALPPSVNVSAMLTDGDYILLGSEEGLMRLNPATAQIGPLPGAEVLKGTPVNTIIPLNNSGKLLIGTRGRGAQLFDKDTKSIESAAGKFDFAKIPSTDITAAFVDRGHNLWLGTFDKGVFRMSRRDDVFNSDTPLLDAFGNDFVTRIAGDSRGRLWVGTRYNGLALWDPVKGSVSYFSSLRYPWLGAFPTQFVQEVFVDSSDRVWVGMDNGLFVCSADDNGNLHNIKAVPRTGNVVTIAEDPHRRVWVGASDGSIRIFDAGLSEVGSGRELGFSSSNITRLLPYDDRHMLVASYLDNIYLIDIDDFTVAALDDKHQKQWDMAIDVYRAHNGNLWIGTYDNGLICYDPSTGEMRHFTDFRSNDILAIREDAHGNIWCCSSYGIYRIDPETDAVNTYLKHDGITGNQYHEKCAFVDGDGSIYFGGNYGLQQILPANVNASHPQIPIYLTELLTLNREPDADDALARTDLPFLKRLDLDYDNNALSIGFTGLDYDSRVEYAYMLEGFDKMWIFPGEYNHAIYSNLPAGSYRFLVKVKDEDVWGEPVQLLELSVDEAPWLHPVAKFGYALLVLLLFVLLSRMYVRLRLEKERFSLAEKQMEDERQMSERKVNFFNNISHELRTPITLIYAPVKYLRHNFRTMKAQDVESSLDYIDRNVDRLLTLTTQILKFRTIQGDSLPMQVAEQNPVAQMESIIGLYNIYAGEKGISIDFSASHSDLKAVYDSDKLEKIVNNLLFNAVKYTPHGGHIAVRLELTAHPEGIPDSKEMTYLEVQVTDDGVGIPPAESQSVFTRFKRFLNPFSNRKEGGFGIGLNYVKTLVDKHHGVITCRPNAVKGLTFIVDLPADGAAYPAEEWVPDNADTPPDAQVADAPAVETESDLETVPEEPVRHKVLVVEDKKEMAEFIASVFGAECDVIVAEDGLAGLQKAQEEMPDVIVSDVMMPLMSGYEMLSRIKNEPSTCHIPVVLLTAKSRDEDKITGYDAGADIYMEKPFHPEVLHSAVNGILSKLDRQKHQVVAMAGTSEVPPADEMTPLDRKFLTKLYAYIDENISNQDLNVNSLGRELGFSRTNFYRKIKALTGVTPNDLLRVCRLNRAAQLLLTREYTMGQISDMVGVGTQSHFSNLFKKQFGMTPREYLIHHTSPSTPRPPEGA